MHATLALAAATALGAVRVDDHGMPPVDENDWLTAASADDIGHGGDPDESPVMVTEELLAVSLTEFGDGPIEYIVPLCRQGPGVFARVRLPIGLTAESFLYPETLERLASSLGRGMHEIHPSALADGDTRDLGLWVADKGVTR